MSATVHLSNDEHDIRRIIQNLKVQKIQRVFETVQAQISSLKLRDHEIYGLSEQVDCTDGYWRVFLYVKDEFLSNSSQKYMCSVMRFCELVESVLVILKQQRSNHNFSRKL